MTTESVLTIPCPTCGLETIDVYWNEGDDPKRAEYHCACLAIAAREDAWGDEADERGLVLVTDPSERTLDYIEQVKQIALKLRSA